MVAVMLLSVGVIALLLYCGLRNAARRDSQVDDLLDEVADEDKLGKHAPAQGDTPKPEPWERDGDWWKK